MSVRHSSVLVAGAAFLLALIFATPPASADLSHARIIRLSLVEGDVRFTRDSHGDPLTDSKNLWEAATLNLPIRQGYVLATDNGRATVEFENGAMAFLNQNTVLEFYDLSLDNGTRTTRLIVRQGSASFYVNSSADYFSVTGGDFTAETTAHATFRLDNFDDGSTVNVIAGHVEVLRKNQNAASLTKGQSFSFNATENSPGNIGHAASADDFDRWVKSHIDSATAASNAGSQYSHSSSYTSGYGDLYTYGSWFPIAGFGYGWQPFGVGLGWSPFAYGGWFEDPFFGWGFIGNQPWGWLPYHYGAWLFQPGIGWVWAPGTINSGGRTTFHSATVAWVRSTEGATGFVPLHPADAHGKAPINLAQGLFTASGSAISHIASVTQTQWKTEKSAPAGALRDSLVSAAKPAQVSRTLFSSTSSANSNSSLTFDAKANRFTTANGSAARSATTSSSSFTASARSTVSSPQEVSSARRNDTVAARRTFTPAPAASARSFSFGDTWSGTSSSSGKTTTTRSTTTTATSSTARSSGGRH
jgi:FecR protein